MRNEEPQGPPEPEAPRREFHFKPTEFDVANRPANATPADAPIDVKQLYRQANAPAPAAPGAVPPSQAENDVHTMLRANLARARAKGENEVVLKRRPMSRRKRDYWTLLIGGNLLVVAVVLLLQKNPISLVFGFSAMIFVSIAVTWIMWFVMDDY